MSTTTKFSPGPWVLGFDHHRTQVRAGDARTGRRIASTFMSDSRAAIEINEANAALIAAAPELYEALVAVLEGVNGARAVEDLDCSTEVGGYLLGDVMNDALDAARAALAKVEAPRG